jgi:hypothetical protein
MNSNPVASEVLTLLAVYFTELCTEYLTVLSRICCVLGDECLEQVSNQCSSVPPNNVLCKQKITDPQSGVILPTQLACGVLKE